MKKYLILILAGLILSPPAFAHAKRPRTDRHNNPTAMIWTERLEAFFLSRGYLVKMGEPFPDTDRYHTLDMNEVTDPIKATIEYIDVHGFYAPWGVRRWEHTAMGHKRWLNLSYRKKVQMIQTMYNKENGTVNKWFPRPNAGHARKQVRLNNSTEAKYPKKRNKVLRPLVTVHDFLRAGLRTQKEQLQLNDIINRKSLALQKAIVKILVRAAPDGRDNINIFVWGKIIACIAVVRVVLTWVISRIKS